MSKITQAQKKILKLQHSIDRIISVRWGLFFVALISLFFYWVNYHTTQFYFISGFLILTFFVTSFIHSSISKNLVKWQHYLELLLIEKNRKDLNWGALPKYRSPELNLEEYDFITATDLHLVGPHSVLHLMDSCISDYGQKTLVSYLLSADTLEQIRLRQNKIKELLPLNIFRTKFKLLGMLHSSDLIRRESLFSIFSMQVLQKRFFAFFALLVSIQFINIILIVATVMGDFKPYFLLSSLMIFPLYQLLKNQSENAFEVGIQLQISLEKLIPIFDMMERLPVKKSEALYSELAAFKDHPPSELLKKINWVVALLSVRANPMLKVILNFLLPWDFGFLIVLERLKSKHYPHLKKWMDSLGKLEALVSLTDYSDNIKGSFPIFLESDSSVYLEAVNLDHPLMAADKRVANSYLIETKSPIAIITGSNMAGKSTFLRTIGLNIALAKAGATVLSSHFRVQNMSVMSLIKAQDFLEKEMSLFYFEVKRLKEILLKGRAGSQEQPFLFLVDEIYRGTNNQERYQGAVAYLKEFTTIPHASGLLTTHDINIAKDLLQGPAIKQYHFREMFKDGALFYDYKINLGVCETTNALRIMESEGLPV
ncbi:MAG: hypothetical protein H0V66_07665 [Bdellovibrionales bacterium]|nr:hypothetical protein [Bdellovibrionales bacterium]